MKISFTYGAGLAGASALMTLVLFALGYHSEPEKMQSIQTIVGILSLVIMIVAIALGMSAARNTSADRSLSFGRAVGVGTLIGLFSGIVGGLFQILYSQVINPSFHEVMYQMQVNAMEAKGMSSDQIANSEKMMRFFSGPIIMFIAGLIMSVLFGVVLSLIIGAIMKRGPQLAPSAAVEPPPAASA